MARQNAVSGLATQVLQTTRSRRPRPGVERDLAWVGTFMLTNVSLNFCEWPAAPRGRNRSPVCRVRSTRRASVPIARSADRGPRSADVLVERFTSSRHAPPGRKESALVWDDQARTRLHTGAIGGIGGFVKIETVSFAMRSQTCSPNDVLAPCECCAINETAANVRSKPSSRSGASV